MTQSGQGEEPSARPAREGIVLPSDGGEPLLPGMTGGPRDAPAGRRPAAPPTGQAPAEGQTWGLPWGPEQQAAPQPGQTWQSPPPQQWHTPEQQAWDGRQPAAGPQDPGALPQQDTRPPQAYDPQAQHAAYGTPQPPEGAYGAPGAGAPLPPEGPQTPGPYGAAGGAPLPPATDAYGAPAAGGMPPASDAYGSPAGAHGHGPAGAPLPPAADEGATQYLPPVAADGAAAATQYLPPVPAAADEGATQYIPPVGPGALPPESTAEDPEATRFLGTGPRAGAGPLPPSSNPDAEATQYIAPVSGGADPQPPAEFGHLFRDDQAAGAPAGATQQLPRVEQHRPQPSHGAPAAGRSRGGRTGSRVPLIAAVGIGIAVLGVGAGALLAGGGGDDDAGDDNKTVAASAPATEGSASPSADPARAQAVELDKLLADSGDSRSAVINAVADVKGCDNLAQAAKDLRDAARQRTQLVTRLGGIQVDRLPDHAALTTALTKAWQASASADNHYAAWADQTAGKKGCKKGQARVTGQTQAGNRASGVASAEKAKAATLWNSIAKTYGLTERQPTQL
ncbi:hypothetical protein [Streptomyces sp. XY006]|uniref:hypothetical protein n=1 Tax=Streptomyces sp. XY006 TaxID=2021410 RepID=UPI000B8BE921|nr:hypothetical protein [Streptomyces sp. XY006]OXS31561.1 hypothetical protein CHR28_30555 [Streptomyces sp. XY006]